MTRLLLCCLAYALTLLAWQEDRDIHLIRVQRRMALVIGNSAYPTGPLKNPANDARDVAAALKRLGFEVTLKEDLTKRGFDRAFGQFAREVHRDDLALFYFAGHGLQVQNENYLVPVDFSAQTEAEVEYEATPASRVRKVLEESGASVRVLILDACRTNPYRFKRDLPGGLAAMTQQAEGTIIAFAANDNQSADDNRTAKNGLYTTHLLRNLEQPGLGLKEVFERARAGVWQASGKTQFPALYDAVIGRLVLKEGPAVSVMSAAPPVVPDLGAQAELAFWNSIQDSKEASDYRAYKRNYPNGKFADLADLRIGRYGVPAPPPVVVVENRGPKVGDSKRNAKDGLTYKYIPAGTFRMGCSAGDSECDGDEKPARDVTLTKGFWLGQTEVTVEAWRRYTQAMGKEMPPEPTWKGRNWNPGWRDGKAPIVNVTWDEAKSYCEWTGGRLPTEAEWEYAARGGTGGARYGSLADVAWYGDNAGKARIDTARIWASEQSKYADRIFENENTFHGVGLKAPNRYGLYDMLGNVWEWVADWYGEKYYAGGETMDPQGPPNGEKRALRGGSWNGQPRNARSSFRAGVEASFRAFFDGVRCGGE